MGYLIEFRDATPLSIFDMQPETALEWFKAKGLRPTFDYRDMIQQEHDVAFTVAKMMDVDLLRTTQDMLAQGMAEGWSKERFTQALAPKLQAAGWWGAKEMEDPLTGNITEAQLGSAHRIKTIYRSNLQSAYATGQWERIQEQAEAAPYLIYDAVDDHRTRPEHGGWDNLVLPVDHPFWRTHMPPNGYNCRCGVIQASEEELEAMGLTPSKAPKVPMKDWTNPRTGKTHKVPQGIDPGWAHNPGQARIEELQKLLAEKAATLPQEAQQGIAQATSAYQTQRAAQAAQQALAKADGASALQRSQAKIQESTAAWQIQNHLDNQTPYMAAAIKAIQKTKGADDLTPSQLLAQASEKAAAAEKSAFLTTYKQYVTKGKQPPAKAQAVFDALPSDEKAKVSEQLATLQAKKAAEQALAELEDGSGAYGKALAKLKASGEADGMGPVQLWKAVTQEAEAAKAKIAQGVNLANYKKAAIAGKPPKDSQLQAYKALDPDAKAAVDEEIATAVAAKQVKSQEAAKAAAAKATKEAQDKAAAEAIEGKTFYHGGANVETEKLSPLSFFTDSKAVAKDYLDGGTQAGKGKIHTATLDIKKPAFDADVEAAAKKVGIWNEYENAHQYLTESVYGPEAAKVAAILKDQGFDGAYLTDMPMSGGAPIKSVIPFSKGQIKAAKAKPKAKPKAKATTPQEEAPAPSVIQAGDTTINPEALTRIGPQAGSNPGGMFIDEETGLKWYIKKPASADIARNEVLAGRLYREAGIEAPDLEMIEFEGGPAVASRIIDGLEPSPGPELGTAKGAREGFVVDAWLGNWDVVGLGYDNLLVQAGRAVRVDTGGALRYRAQGGLKGAAWGKTVDELDSLRNPSINPQAASVFGDISQEELLAGARSVLAVSPERIRKLVDDLGPSTKRERDTLYRTLIARQKDIAKRYPEAAKPKRRRAAAKPKDSGERVTQQEKQAIEESRANGYGIATDKDQIEDQEVLFWRETGPDGKPQTGAEFKLRGQAMIDLDTMIGGGDMPEGNKAVFDGLLVEKGEIDDAILTAIKGMYSNGKEGLRPVDVYRANDAIMAFYDFSEKVEKMEKAGVLARGAWLDMDRQYGPFINALVRAKEKEIGTPKPLPAGLMFEPGELRPALVAPKDPAKKPPVTFERRQISKMRLKEARRGHLRATNKAAGLEEPIDSFEATVDGVHVEYWPASQRHYAMAGRMRITAPGGEPASAAQIYATMEKLGIDTSRPNPLDQEELYLRQMAMTRSHPGRREMMESILEEQPDQGKRIDYLKATLKEATGKDVTALPGYRPQGQREAFDTGHIRRYRADLHGKDWDKFQETHRLTHENLTGMPMTELLPLILDSGGKLITTTDKLRRGIPLKGASPFPDLESGGANFAFTRIKPKRNAKHIEGFVWKARQVARTDAVTYNGDYYGEMRDGYSRKNRLGTVEDYTEVAATASRNETLLKNGISIFEDLQALQVQAHEREAILQLFRDHGYDRWPDGRDLEEVIVVSSRGNY